MLNNVIFYIFAIILIFAATMVVTVKNSVHAVLYLILTFISSSCLWIFLNIEFLALGLIFIYLGAVMVLFLFVVMMLDFDNEAIRSNFWNNLPLALFLGLLILAELIIVILTKSVGIGQLNKANYFSMNELFYKLYTEYSYPVELASFILLLGLIVAVTLTLKPANKGSKFQNINSQIKVNPKERLELIDIPSENKEITSDRA